MANILFVHQNFPGQFPHIVQALLNRGDKLAAIGSKTAKAMPGVDLRRWMNQRGSTNGIFPPAVRAEADLIRAHEAAGAAYQLKKDGFAPDVIVGHPGWGETIFLKEVWPEARIVLLGEMMYRSHGGDFNFDPEFSRPDPARDEVAHAKNATQVLAYAYADRIVCPTPFQASSFAPGLRPMITVLHEGLDLDRAKRRPDARFTLADGRVLDGSRPVITFVNRTFEPLRGFHVFMRALPDLLAAVPEAEVVLVGGDDPSGYGVASPDRKGWKAAMLDELGDRLDLSRVHFVGRVPIQKLIDIFSISWGHVYYTYPFVLSWSLVEAMACECLVIASDTPPLHDAMSEREGVLVPFFDIGALSQAMIRACREPELFMERRRAARVRALADFDRFAGVAGWLSIIDELAARRP